MISEVLGNFQEDDDHTRFDFLPPNLPVDPTNVSAWAMSSDKRSLERKFQFPNIRSRNAFLLDIMKLENTIGHNIDFKVSDSDVFIALQTKHLGLVTEVDLECSKHLTSLATEVINSRL
tara:strand:+ start:260 stop:616 length:357 start_codon:yes stop_codon:yes gene_type:complete